MGSEESLTIIYWAHHKMPLIQGVFYIDTQPRDGFSVLLGSRMLRMIYSGTNAHMDNRKEMSVGGGRMGGDLKEGNWASG